MQSDASCYEALKSRDPRFDGVFFVGVTSTGIYCRPVCPAKTPKPGNCRFFGSAEAAEAQAYRPCLRCRPELAPGSAPMDDARRIAQQWLARVDESAGDEDASLEGLAGEFELTARQIRRIIRREYGVSPVQLVRTRRLLLAKQLLTETTLPVVQVAFASGFKSVRRFNDVFLTHYRMPPGRLRAGSRAAHRSPPAIHDSSVVRLSYRPPYDWDRVLAFLRMRMLKGAEWCTDTAYCRTVRLPPYEGWVMVTHAPAKHGIQVAFSNTLAPALPTLLRRLRNLFDLDARPDLIALRLQQDPLLRKAVAANPGLRVPGAFDGFELALRAILGQQVTVRAATTLAGRLTTAFGAKCATPFAELAATSPSAARMAALSVDAIARHGIIQSRAKSMLAVARAIEDGTLSLAAGADPQAVFENLLNIPGIGPWTANYIAMRALRWPDAFPKEDIIVRRRLGNLTPAKTEARSQAWRPWRSYAVLHLWNMAP